MPVEFRGILFCRHRNSTIPAYITTTVSWQYLNSVGTGPKYYRNCKGTGYEHYRNGSCIVGEPYRNITERVPKQYRNSTETVRNRTRTIPEQNTNSQDTASDQYGNSTEKASDHNPTSSGIVFEHYATIPQQYWKSIGIVLLPCGDHTKPVPELYEYSTGTVPEQYRNRSCIVTE